MKEGTVQLLLRVSPRTKDLLKQFAKEDRRFMTSAFEVLMEQEATRRLQRFGPSSDSSSNSLSR